MIEPNEPLNGYRLDLDDDDLLLTFSNRYGHIETFRIKLTDAQRIARQILELKGNDGSQERR